MRYLVLAMLVACSSGSRREEAAAAMPTTVPTATTEATSPAVYVTTPSGEIKVTVEIVATDAKIQRGMMYREHLPPDAGMLFLMGRSDDWAFYMRNTLIPLDMIFITSDLTIAGIVASAEPRTETLRRIGKPSMYVLEVNGGWSAHHQVTAGAKVRFDNVRP